MMNTLAEQREYILSSLVIMITAMTFSACKNHRFERSELSTQSSNFSSSFDEKSNGKLPRDMFENISDSKVSGDFKGGYLSQQLISNEESHVWIATRRGFVIHLLLENGVVKSKKSWSGAGPNSGTRTYVLEGGGVILAKNGGHLYFLHEGVSEGVIDKDPTKGNYFKLTGPDANDRACVVSYKRDGQRFLGIGYGDGYFVEIAQEETPPFAPKFSTASAPIKAVSSPWGYSCYIDQSRLIYYGQYVNAPTKTFAFDLTTKQAMDVKKAPNAAFASTNLPKITVGPNAEGGNGSYAMSGDRQGHVFNATGYTTLAFEPRNAMVWGSSGGLLSIFPHACLYKATVCSDYATFNLIEAIGTGIGPMSALGDGHMVGLVRSIGDVYLFKLKDSGDATKGIDTVKIAERVGNGDDPYMYTDFTGATLYLKKSLNEFDLSKSPTWIANAPLKNLKFTWLQATGGANEWRDIKAEFRCYNDPANKGSFKEVSITIKAKADQDLFIETCNKKSVSKVEVMLTQLGVGTSLSAVHKIQITAFQ